MVPSTNESLVSSLAQDEDPQEVRGYVHTTHTRSETVFREYKERPDSKP